MNILFAVPLLFSLPYRAGCTGGQAKDKVTLVRIEQEWVRAAEHHDTAALECILADEFEEADFDGSLISRAAMLASAAKPNSGHSELTDLHVHLYGEAAYVRGVGVNSENGRPSRRTRFTDVFVYRAGRWQCVAGHDSRVPKAR